MVMCTHHGNFAFIVISFLLFLNKFSVSQTIEHLFHSLQNTILLRKVSEKEVGFEIFLNDNKN